MKKSFLITKNHLRICALWLFAIPTASYPKRNVYRPKETNIPTVTVFWSDEQETQKFSLRSRYLDPYPFFGIFDKHHFETSMLPTGPISFRYDAHKSVNGKELARLVDELIEELKQKKSEFSHFTVLRERDFNRKKLTGLIIVKCNDYPFVIKLFMEYPESFLHPYRKGIVPTFIFFLGGGINRHLSGFTRIKNAAAFRLCIQNDAEWLGKVDIPRKWYLLPHSSRWISIEGEHFADLGRQTINVPATYCIIADAIDIDRSMSMMNKDDRTTSLRLCNTVHFSIDPNITNFMFEKAQSGQEQKIVVVDTEHFPSMVGLKEKDLQNRIYKSQFAWYRDLVIKGFQDMFFKPKQ